MLVIPIIVLLLILALVVMTRRFLQTRKRSDLQVMIALACLIAIIAIPMLMVILDIGTNGWG